MKIIRDVVQDLKEKGIDHAIIVLKADITSFAANSFKNFKSVHIEHFNMRDVMYNITKHVMVPKHELLTKKEIQDLKQQLRIRTLSCLKKIRYNDPICRYFDAKLGNVFRIYRPSPDGHMYIAHRLVVRACK